MTLGMLLNKFGGMVAILTVSEFMQGKFLRFYVCLTKAAIKSTKVVAQIKAKTWGYPYRVALSSKMSSPRVPRSKCKQDQRPIAAHSLR